MGEELQKRSFTRFALQLPVLSRGGGMAGAGIGGAGEMETGKMARGGDGGVGGTDEIEAGAAGPTARRHWRSVGVGTTMARRGDGPTYSSTSATRACCSHSAG
jgi:hypothetical protein